MFVRIKPSGPRKYVQIVENFRENGKVKQRVIANLGRLDILQQSGQLDQITAGLAKLSETCAVITANRAGDTQVSWDKEWGPALIFGGLWKQLGFPELIAKLKASHKIEYDVERAIFLSILHRLLNPGSDLHCSKWRCDHLISGISEIQLHHLYRCMDFLSDYKEQMEQWLFDRGRTLFDSQIDLVFFDTTTVYFEGDGPEEFADYGYSRDHRPDRKQILVGVAMSRCGYPLSCEFWPGNTSDLDTVSSVIQVIQKRFRLNRVIFVADRGLVSTTNIDELAHHGLDYILGVRMRRLKRIKSVLLSDETPFEQVKENLHVKELKIDEERFIVCLNPEQAEKDRQTRDAIVAKLNEKLRQGAKQLVANRGYARFLRIEKDAVMIDSDKIEQDQAFDGKYVLTTNTTLSAREVALSYKGLWQVERGFRNLKSALEVRPVFHRTETRVKGHVFASFLALVLMTAMEKKLEQKGIKVSWDDFIRDLRAFRAIKTKFSGKTYQLRTECRGDVASAFRALGLRIPPVIQSV